MSSLERQITPDNKHRYTYNNGAEEWASTSVVRTRAADRTGKVRKEGVCQLC